jgi:integrase
MDKLGGPVSGGARTPRLSRHQRAWLKHRLQPSGETALFICLLLETALRPEELLSLCWRHVNLEKHLALIPNAEKGRPRTIPLSPRATRLLASKPRTGERVTGLTAEALMSSWTELCTHTAVQYFHLYDLHHEALARFRELGLKDAELAAIGGYGNICAAIAPPEIQPPKLAAKLWRLAGAEPSSEGQVGTRA